ncbi:MAG: phospho-N-acetylmuramoyl-pentapeptide-transferase [Yaniella sp.]|uniref:phospho-N-acetylmuramoyl-pentapeptide- transferase n=1 Tax=Yaniella sp. TaxID=2773929 RepID=UPI00264A46E1|nr:phospho-N-acetylmuramoyl-pentapeptide-transferase [Yaniella sp.]MDN5704635.1 phospho-N-acetylmuramoyl-pentapeptide-transferase [Yaniella sp.]MDN5730222.1 phospho-N-acetylmuramoyl-pentapeptide-transferase [Yaniella sp.]MDN5743307.1 phospho-N-acetylmuramoyl-pentapeptide-transferase [Yaniella sp.]MDN5814300.1 phospho-N-acetylmuramoyl-pentapeptide-transferase [Yaniella sp.]MDN5817235.1 phospho-N-acetylmuramoyl-pentapeptide-transferase [Yaniella sp.]
MIGLLIGAVLGVILTVVGTPLFIRLLNRRGYGQIIRDDGPTTHATKRGTPTMGGVVIVIKFVLVYFVTHWIMSMLELENSGITVSALLLLFLTAGMGLIGFLDDYIKISNQRSLGLTPTGKIVGQGAVGITFAILALNFPNSQGFTPASTAISVFRDTSWDLAFFGATAGAILFVIWSNLITTATTNAVNLTDGLDGLATGAVAMVSVGYVLITLFQNNQACSGTSSAGGCYEVRDPMDLALLGSILAGVLLGFLWWNTAPAKIFMGDTGSLALGGALAGFAIFSKTQVLLVVLAGLMVVIAASVIIQVGYFKISGGKRVFLMAPLQHHFELKGWEEVTVVVRFWLIGLGFVVAALAMFYAEWVILR